jgi:hypothetical protein
MFGAPIFFALDIAGIVFPIASYASDASVTNSISVSNDNGSSNTSVKTIINGKTVEDKEHLNSTTIEVGTIYFLTDNLNLQGKYSTSTNNSNNTTTAYKANIISANIGIRF